MVKYVNASGLSWNNNDHNGNNANCDMKLHSNHF